MEGYAGRTTCLKTRLLAVDTGSAQVDILSQSLKILFKIVRQFSASLHKIIPRTVGFFYWYNSLGKIQSKHKTPVKNLYLKKNPS